ncbi:AMP-binding protein [Ktedonosporobacter rubrisoli]|nr:AMP-binding protein [Ktedonosporobacter rubrisoli]
MGMTGNGLSYWRAETSKEPLQEITVGDLLDQRANEIPEREAIVYSCYPEYSEALDIRWTYQDYRSNVDEVARGLLALGLQKGEHIAVWSLNMPEWLLLQMAAAKAGLVLVTIDPAYQGEELTYALKQADVVALFFMARMHEHDCRKVVRSLLTPGLKYGEVSSTELPQLRYVCLLGASPSHTSELEDWRPALFREIVAHGAQISSEALQQRQATIRPGDPAIIQFTAGTTGTPRGVVLTHYSILNNAIDFATRWGVSSADSCCTAIPFFYVSGCILAALGSLYKGTTLHPLIAFDPARALQICSVERCTLLGATPDMLSAMLHHPEFSNYDLSSLRAVVSGGAPVAAQLMEEVKERTGADVAIVFVQTEASAAITLTRPDDPFELKAATVGVPLPHIEVKVINPATGKLVACGEPGELCCRGYLVMQGYYNMPDRTAESIDGDGWLHTGDLVSIDTHGYVSIIGLLKEMIVRGGETIFPREIEAVLSSHSAIADVYVLGIPDRFFGEELLAVIRAHQPGTLSEEDVRSYCQGRLSRQKIPRYFQFVESFPMTTSGKIQKFVLREQAIKALGLESTIAAQTV